VLKSSCKSQSSLVVLASRASPLSLLGSLVFRPGSFDCTFCLLPEVTTFGSGPIHILSVEPETCLMVSVYNLKNRLRCSILSLVTVDGRIMKPGSFWMFTATIFSETWSCINE
jgi:hypothetical protein